MKIWNKLEEVVINCTKQSEEPLSFKDIAERTGLDRHTVSRVANRLKRQNRAEIESFATAKIIRTKGGRDG